MIQIDPSRCIGCGRCVEDCFPGDIVMQAGKAVPKGHNCIECGHCVAVCPGNAVTLERYNMGEVLELDGLCRDIEPQAYLNHLKSRRSIRRFTGEPVSREDVSYILEAGRYSPTGGNLQNVSYYVAQEDIPVLKTMLLRQLKAMGEHAQATGNPVSWYSDMWLEMYDEFQDRGIDRLFFDAGTVIVVSSNSPQSACIAAAHMETMVYSLGLGMLYSGFAARAIGASQALREHLHLKEGYEVYAVLVIGHPDVQYVRTVPRKPADVIWN